MRLAKLVIAAAIGLMPQPVDADLPAHSVDGRVDSPGGRESVEVHGVVAGGAVLPQPAPSVSGVFHGDLSIDGRVVEVTCAYVQHRDRPGPLSADRFAFFAGVLPDGTHRFVTIYDDRSDFSDALGITDRASDATPCAAPAVFTQFVPPSSFQIEDVV